VAPVDVATPGGLTIILVGVFLAGCGTPGAVKAGLGVEVR